MKLAGRVALVTGASQGIATPAPRPSPEGDHRRRRPQPREARRTRRRHRRRRSQAAAFVIDVADEDQIKSESNKPSAIRKIDILVNNAGITATNSSCA